MSKKKNIIMGRFDPNQMINLEDPNLTEEELVWERLKHGVKEETVSEWAERFMAEEIRRAMDDAILADIRRIAKGK